MASAIICEGCGATLKCENAKHIRVHRLCTATTFHNNTEDHFDVCKECYKKMTAMLEHKEANK